MADELKLTLDVLIKDEMDGKYAAIARYDAILWKVRAGYATLLYGAVGVVAALVNQKVITLTSRTALAVAVLVFGFSVFGALLDYGFISSKVRVVNYRDELTRLSYLRATQGSLDVVESARLLECLKNSGERKERVDWTNRAGRSVPLLYYGGTGVFCILASWLLAS